MISCLINAKTIFDFTLSSLSKVLSLMWSSFTKYNGGAHEATSDVGGAFFMMLQVLLTGGYEDNIEHFNQRVLFAIAVMVGITLVSVLIGIITDTVRALKIRQYYN